MIEPIHLIHFELTPEPKIIFKRSYAPNVGPLPELSYKLIGLWTYKDIVVRVLFEAPEIPVQNTELIFHRYEGENIVHQGQANYRYFASAGYAGMILNKKTFSKKLDLAVQEIWFSFSEKVNQNAAEQALSGSHHLELHKAVDRLGQLAPVLFATVNPSGQLNESSKLSSVA